MGDRLAGLARADERVLRKRELPTATIHPADDQLGSSPRKFDGVKVFSATMVAQRDTLGDVVTEWLAAHRQIEIT
jgi:hypothetical protein